MTLFRLHFSQLNLGDIIGVGCSGSGRLLGIFHLGIYVGNGEVIDYTNDSRVHKAHLDDFLRTSSSSSSPNTRSGSHMGDLLRIHYSGMSGKYNPDVIRERAQREFKSQTFGEFNTFDNNCEHFATNCVFGVKFSYQVEIKAICGPFSTIEVVN